MARYTVYTTEGTPRRKGRASLWPARPLPLPVRPRSGGHGHTSCRQDIPGQTRSATAVCNEPVELNPKSGETVTTISHCCGNRSRRSRKASRIIRLILFRRTAPLIILWTLIPSRLQESSLATKTSVNPDPLSRFPRRYTSINSHDFRRRSCLGSPNLFTDSR